MKTEKLFAALFENAPLGMAAFSLKGHFITANAAMLKMLGYASLDDIRQGISEDHFLNAADHALYQSYLNASEPVDQPKILLKSKGGTPFYGHLTMKRCPLDQETIILVTLNDVTEQVLAQQTLVEQEARYHQIIAQSGDGIILLDSNGIVVDWNRGAEQVFGIPREAALSTPFWNLMEKVTPQEDRSPEAVLRLKNMILMAVQDRQADWMGKPLERRILLPDGQMRQVQTVVFPIESPSGFMFASITRDLTGLKQIEDALRESEQRYRAVVSNLPEYILIHQDEKLVFANQAALDRFGYAWEQVAGANIFDFLPPHSHEALRQKMMQRQHGNKMEAYEIEMTTRSGETVYVTVHGSLINYGGKLAFLLVMMDVTERKRIEGALLVSQKAADVAVLAAGMAHELNSPLQVIIGASESLLEDINQNGELDRAGLKHHLELIRRNGWRSAELLRLMLMYALPQNVEKESVDLNTLVDETLILVGNLLHSDSGVTIVTDLAPDLPEVTGNRSHISQALLNLFSNAFDAMPYGGDLFLRTRYDPESREVSLSVQDTGEGIAPEIQARIFDPFFTTKPPGKGVGMGLAAVQSAIKAHGGRITFESKPQRGSTFTLHFPLLPMESNGGSHLPAVRGRYDDSL
ncbi:MAG TPA: PAS domain S-box protein [Anaerolineaceae bacterium]|nr:PAS domain S-box protein [Anaerolineaceae bacterium]HPN51878.1 PAS domain S-box protein [Anaerolineaceae bacterium]